MTDQTRVGIQDQRLRQRVLNEWMLGNSIEQIRKSTRLTLETIEAMLCENYRLDNYPDIDKENGAFQPINLQDFHPLTRARLHQVILNEPSEYHNYDWRIEQSDQDQ